MKGTSLSQVIRAPSGLRLTATECHDGKYELFIHMFRGEIMAIVTVGVDLAKNVFAVHGVDATGRPVLLHPCKARMLSPCPA